MIDLELLRKNPEIFREEIKKRNMRIDVDADLVLDEKRRDLIFKVDELRARKNETSKLIPGFSGEKKTEMVGQMKLLNEDLNLLFRWYFVILTAGPCFLISSSN